MKHSVIEVFLEQDKKIRIDQWLGENCEYTRSQIKKMIQEGKILLNNTPIKKSGFLVKHGDLITILFQDKIILPMKMALDIVYEDSDLLIVNKPKNMLVYPVKDMGEKTLVNGLLAYCELSNLYGPYRPGLIHRIDRETSGLVMVAKNNEIHQKMVDLLAEHKICREYIGITKGIPPEKKGTINKPISHDYSQGIKRVISEKDGQSAVTHYACVFSNQQYSLMRFVLETGRTHQIRLHMASIGCPLVGDSLYGENKNTLGVKGQALHAHKLSFIHPKTNERITVFGKAPHEFKKAVRHVQNMGL